MSRNGGSVFDRLTDQKTFTGVYAERFKSGGGINGHADSGNVADLSKITRPQYSGRGSGSHFGTGQRVHQYNTSGMEKDTPSSRLQRGASSSSSSSSSPEGRRARSSSPSKRGGGGGGSIFDRLTDQSSYTGVYAERFKSGGGINGHADSGNVADLSKITRPQYSGRGSGSHFGTGQRVHQYNTSGMEKDTPSSRSGPRSASSSAVTRNRSSSPGKRGAAGGGGSSIFDRLTDKSSYTGVYAERFRSGGGINGHSKGGGVADLSHITRAGF